MKREARLQIVALVERRRLSWLQLCARDSCGDFFDYGMLRLSQRLK
jgi:hypothetical protein